MADVPFKTAMNPEAQHVIDRLGLEPLPAEGGYFRAVWTSATLLPSGRAAASAIYFLLTPGEFSAWHRLAAEELWHFAAGDPIDHVQLDPATGRVAVARLGPEVATGDLPQLLVRGGVWQGARLAPGGRRGWALVGCTVSPAWDQAEFELGNADDLCRTFPGNDVWVRELTR
jgi:uncharacterized protein